MPSQAFRVFNGKKTREVLEIADVFEEINAHPGPNTKYSLLNGALVLLVSSWEVYCEDVCRQAVKKVQGRPSLSFAQLNEKLRKDLIRYAGDQYKGKQDPLTEKLAMLPDGRLAPAIRRSSQRIPSGLQHAEVLAAKRQGPK